MNSIRTINTIYSKVPSIMGHSGDEKRWRFATAVGSDVVPHGKVKSEVAHEERLKTGILKFTSRRIAHDVNPANERFDDLGDDEEKEGISTNAAPALAVADNNKQSSTPKLDGIKSLFTQNESTPAASTSQQEPVPIVLISDPGQDLDDEMMFIMASHLQSLKLISIRGVVTNLHPAPARARLTRGTLNLLGLHHVPVGIGTDGGDTSMMHSSAQFEATSRSYIIKEEDEAAMRGLGNGQLLLKQLYQAAPDIEYVDTTMEEEGTNNGNRKTSKRETKGGLTIVITSSLKDISIFVRDNPTVFASKTREVVVMGGCKPISTDNSDDDDYECCECEPDSANNNTFDPQASDHFYSTCQQMNITLTVVSRHTAYAAKTPRTVYDDLASTGSPIGLRLRVSQCAGIDQLWRRANTTDPGVRKGLPARCDRRWFVDTFCGGNHIPLSRSGEDSIWDGVTGFMQYDTIALLASIPGVREVLFDPMVLPPLSSEVTIQGGNSNSGASLHAYGIGTRNLIGISEKEHGLKEPSLLVQLLKTGYRRGLMCNNVGIH